MNEIHSDSHSKSSRVTSKQDLDDVVKTSQQSEEIFNDELNIETKRRGYKGRPFSQLEDDLILHLVETYGPKFKKFLKFFRGRDYNNLKNRYYKFLKCEDGQTGELSSKTTKRKKNKQEQQTSPSKIILKNFERQQETLNKTLVNIDIEEDIQFLMFNFMNNMFNLFNNIS